MITTDSASALGAADGHDFGARQIVAIIGTLQANLLSAPAERDSAIGAAMLAWSLKQTEERSARRLELAVRGATAETLAAFEAGWAAAYDMQMRNAAADLGRLTGGEEAPAKPNRTARRKAKAAERKDLQ